MDDTLLKDSLVRFYSQDNNLEKLLSVVRQQRNTHISLRLIDYFVVTYVKEVPVIYQVGDQSVDVYKSYRANQERFKKRCFDPFARGTVSEWVIHGEKLKSNARQLCFMRWAIENGVLDYIRENMSAISEAMLKDVTMRKSLPQRKKGFRKPGRPQYLATRTNSKIKLKLVFT